MFCSACLRLTEIILGLGSISNPRDVKILSLLILTWQPL